MSSANGLELDEQKHETLWIAFRHGKLILGKEGEDDGFLTYEGEEDEFNSIQYGGFKASGGSVHWVIFKYFYFTQTGTIVVFFT